MEIKTFFDKDTYTLTYVVFDDTKEAVVIDSVLDYEPQSSTVKTDSIDKVCQFIAENNLQLRYVLETHAHADHLSGSQILKERYPDLLVAIGKNIVEVQKVFKEVFNLPKDFPTDARQFDHLMEEGKVLKVGNMEIETFYTPGHTPACATYKIDNVIFTGDALFMPDMGTGRCDFPGGSASDLYESITKKLYTLPDDTKVFVGHDYMPGGRELRYESTIKEQKENNIQLPGDRSQEEFVKFRQTRDATLSAPRLLFQSVQVNVDAGNLPQPEDNKVRYLKIPINVFRPASNQTKDVTLEDV
ncbi:MBL fold metallo-hydrolase [Candidatus Uabimicrobium amorphum]|uniref:MBL fold metallo-hydrolase n=1 Tax=Uabimicrobium amorphum TaxID=2596890 RepID=A0A5S9F788_UABAM|nr:MBL fold metallo-hydrolase [Candidatus Uabimicrobium amorphum]BBM86982.1 MBL fold metallo-hydrolase [Candidatus Uabimicrobium amorphum]